MSISLAAEARHCKGKSFRNQLAKESKIPAVLYGNGIESKAVAVDLRKVEKIVREFGTSQVMDLQVDNGQYKVMIKSLQHDPLTQEIIHMDFLSVNLNESIKTNVPLRLIGEPKGIKDGGILQQQVREIEVECLPTDIPEAIEADISHLGVDEGIHVSELKGVNGVEILTDPETLIATIAFAKNAPVEEQDASAEGEAPSAAPEEKE